MAGGISDKAIGALQIGFVDVVAYSFVGIATIIVIAVALVSPYEILGFVEAHSAVSAIIAAVGSYVGGALTAVVGQEITSSLGSVKPLVLRDEHKSAIARLLFPWEKNRELSDNLARSYLRGASLVARHYLPQHRAQRDRRASFITFLMSMTARRAFPQ